jgi:tungstate transport system ATP-binding protein
MTHLLTIEGLQLRRGGQVVLTVDALDIALGETLALIGPNGAGKSSLLLAMAGLLKPTGGQIWYRGQAIGPQDNLAYRRQIALVLQDPLLQDTSVSENVAAGLKFRRSPRAEITDRVNEWLDRFGIAHLKDRPARKLSGGEAQRVSLARAFAIQPAVLLLDEPFSALDGPSRTRLLDDFRALLAETHQTTVVITHDQDEALLLADRVAVLLHGRVTQVGAPEAVFAAPADEAVAAFVGMETLIPGDVVSAQNGQVAIAPHHIPGMRLFAATGVAVGSPVLLCLRPEDVTISLGNAPTTENHLHGRITRLTTQGPLVRLMVDVGFPLTALVTRSAARELGLAVGLSVTATFQPNAAHVISPHSPGTG